jgi:hypothetical protein
MGCGLRRVTENTRSSTQDLKNIQAPFKLSDSRRMKKKGLFMVNEVSSSQEYSSIKGVSGSDLRIRMRADSKDSEND